MAQALHFEPYGKSGRDTGVLAYALVDGAIHVRFQNGDVYVYDDTRPGLKHVKAMTQLAREGAGLSTYISRYVQDRYAQKQAHP